MTSMIQQLHQHEATQASVALTALARRQIVAHIGCAENHHTFAWASHETINDAPSAKIVLSLCADLPPLHQEAMRLADEVLVLNLAGHIDARTLYELCAAHNLCKPITWLEDWPMYCPTCRCSGPEAEHFFHTTLSLHDLNDLFETLTASQLAHLDGQLADWYGQIVPVILLLDGYPALQVDLTCSSCDHFARTAYAIAGEYGAWATLLAADGAFLADFCDADARTQALVCTECAAQVAARRALPPVRVIGDGLQQHATQYYHREYSLTLEDLCAPVGSALPAKRHQTSIDRAQGQRAVLQAFANAATDVRPLQNEANTPGEVEAQKSCPSPDDFDPFLDTDEQLGQK